MDSSKLSGDVSGVSYRLLVKNSHMDSFMPRDIIPVIRLPPERSDRKMKTGKKWRLKARLYVCISAFWTFPLLMACSDVKSYCLEPGELFPDGKPLGQPYTYKQPEIRMVRVSSVHEADSFCLALPNQYPGCRIYYTHDTPVNTYEVGIIYIMDPMLNARGIKEIHFVETVKPRKK